jgi:phage gpG-like protein
MKFTWDATGALQKIEKLKDFEKVALKRLNYYASEVVKRAVRNVSGIILGAYGSGRHATAHLRRNIFFKSTIEPGKKLSVDIGTGILVGKEEVKYAAIHEYGGPIKPKKGKYLTIPFPGVDLPARSYFNTMVIKSKAGNLIIIQKGFSFQGKKAAGWKPLFLLKKEVQMPARHWLSRSMEEEGVLLQRILNPPEFLQAVMYGEGARED